VGEPELKMQIPRYPPVGKPIPVIPFGQGIHVFHKPVDSFFKQLPDFFMASSLDRYVELHANSFPSVTAAPSIIGRRYLCHACSPVST
jgi:hypothetical protein